MADRTFTLEQATKRREAFLIAHPEAASRIAPFSAQFFALSGYTPEGLTGYPSPDTEHLAELEAELTQAQQTITRQDKEIGEYKEEIDKLHALIAELRRMVPDLSPDLQVPRELA